MKFGSDFVFRKDSHATALLRNWFTLTPAVGTGTPLPHNVHIRGDKL